ncbi:MAG TPA: glycerol-3-phosphate dehydrogenase/oxidase [Candidatus Binataceae bacterium]
MHDEVFDLLVIGGGINGAAVARDAAMRGLKVALVDRGDFAGQTSSRSSKLIHGGFRYLPQGQLRLVYSALRERERLRHLTAPHLVRPIRFLLPVYRDRGFGRFTMALGLSLYDMFARIPTAEWHRNLGAAAVRELEPALSRDRLTGGVLYYDAWTDDARLTFENALDADLHGAAVANYVAVEGFTRDSAGRVAAAHARDMFADAAFEIRASVFVNAAGPWVDDIRQLDDPSAAPSVRLTKGVHLVFARADLPVRESLVLADEAGRIVFVMPHDRYVLVGTTDTDYGGDRAAVSAEVADVAYLLSVLSESLPGIRLAHSDVLSSFAGLRALVDQGGAAPSSVSREEEILMSGSGLITVAGGKLTTHREIAQKLTDRVMRSLARPGGRCPTLDTPLPGARPLVGDDGAEVSGAAGAAVLKSLGARASEILVARYGTRAAIVALIAASRPELAEPLAPGCPALGAEVVHAVRNEMVYSIQDFLVRRTALTWRSPTEAATAAPAVARLMASELNWDRAREDAELAGFARDLQSRRAAA